MPEEIHNVLITGDMGYIGSRLVEKIKRETEAKIHVIDLRHGTDILTAPLPEVDVVFHLAAQSGAMPSMEDPLFDARSNILGTIRIAQHYKDTPIIYATSGGAKDPESPYGLSKKTGEEYLKMLAKYWKICRLSSVYGDKPRGVVDTFLTEKKPVVYGDGSAVRDFVHVDDIVQGLFQSVEWDVNKEYEMGSGKGTTIKEIVDATGKRITYQDSRAGEIHTAILQNTTPDWKPEIDVLEYVRSKS